MIVESIYKYRIIKMCQIIVQTLVIKSVPIIIFAFIFCFCLLINIYIQ